MAKKRNWVVRMECTVLKDVNIDGCTEEQAYSDPWDQDVVGELEVDMLSWEVISVRPNE